MLGTDPAVVGADFPAVNVDVILRSTAITTVE